MERRPCFIRPLSRRACADRNIATPAGQAQKEFYVNEAHFLLDLLVHGSVEGIAEEPPADPLDNEVWIVGEGAIGDWSGKDGQLAAYRSGAWYFVNVQDGAKLFDRGAGQHVLRDGNWKRPVVPAEPATGSTVDAEARLAIAGLIEALRNAGIFPRA